MTTQSNESEFEIVDPVTGDPIVEKAAKNGAPTPEPAKEDKFELPEKLKGKSEEDLAKMYLELEKMSGKQANELGQLRKSVNDIIQREFEQSNSSSKAEEMEAELEYGDLVDDPKKAIKKAVSTDLDGIRKELHEFKTANAMEKFTAKHPDFRDIAADASFQEWVMNSPFRVRMYQAADAGDLAVADELFSEYKALGAQHRGSEEPANLERSKALKAVAAESSGARNSGKVKKYRRSSLVQLRVSDPAKYEANRAEFERAYAEKRVIDDL